MKAISSELNDIIWEHSIFSLNKSERKYMKHWIVTDITRILWLSIENNGIKEIHNQVVRNQVIIK